MSIRIPEPAKCSYETFYLYVCILTPIGEELRPLSGGEYSSFEVDRVSDWLNRYGVLAE